MTPDFVKIPCVAVGLLASLLLSSPAFAQDAKARLAGTVSALEAGLDARIGVLVRDSGSDWQWGYRSEERFLMASTFKSVLCGAVLDRVAAGTLSLDDPLEVRQADILDYAPVTEAHVGETMSVGDLCLASLDMSDNTAANLLINRLGGPQEVTAFLRRIGDSVTRLDRSEPDLNLFDPDDPRDTTSPAAMLSTWEAMLLGEALPAESRAQLTDWMSHGGVTGALIRASMPTGWQVADKSGSGEGYTRNLVAMISPPDSAPYFVAIYISDSPTDFETRNAALIEVGAAVADVLEARETK
ncbi:class A beta-lactamase [Cypionkella sp.]|uniref:class A beta-lactamase n=1 Tax=Cypionkella sp. TaxID=2811411 RepID=UPI002AB9D678|nr:class A beta-lactamase [Cypionkella sp.]MDZ4392063.1 class A beta-lactamase [Cypionkella sp.]